jgi:4a-hydroxytetrahydrobiopterin dehydratase
MSRRVLSKDFDYSGVIPLWRLEPSGMQITREFVFKNFKEAFAFMTLCAQYAEEIDHHPDWQNSWSKVVVHLSTHSAKGLTELDIQMAKAMDAFAMQIQA